MKTPPVVTFHLHNATSFMPAGANHLEVSALLTGKVESDDLFASKELWEAVMKKLEGLKVSSVANLTEAMLEVSRVKMVQAEKALEVREAAMRSEIEQLKQQVSFLQAEVLRRDQMIAQLSADAAAYKELMAAAEALAHQPL